MNDYKKLTAKENINGNKNSIHPFQQLSPGGQFVETSIEESSLSLNADNLFALFTAEIIKRKIVFTR
jgi:hypothetical protein